MTRTTSASVSHSVNFTSETDSRMDLERSKRMLSFAEPGSMPSKTGISFRTFEATSTVFSPGCFWIARMTPRVEPLLSMYQAAVLSFSTLSIARPMSLTLTGEPFR